MLKNFKDGITGNPAGTDLFVKGLGHAGTGELGDWLARFVRGVEAIEAVRFDHRDIEFTNAVGKIDLGTPVRKESSGGTNYCAYRIKGEFQGEFLFPDYPFDTQELVIRFRHNRLRRENLIYVKDLEGMKQTRPSVLGKNGQWDLVDAVFFKDIMKNRSTLGDPRLFDEMADMEYSRFNGVVTIKRKSRSFFVKNLLPVMIIIMLAYLSFYIPLDQFSTINSILSGSILSIALFHLKLSSELPGIGYEVVLDKVFYTLYLLIAFSLLVVLLSLHREKRPGGKKREKPDISGQVCLSGRYSDRVGDSGDPLL